VQVDDQPVYGQTLDSAKSRQSRHGLERSFAVSVSIDNLSANVISKIRFTV
jgi:hypothetical protein